MSQTGEERGHDGPARSAADFAERTAPPAGERAHGMFGDATESMKMRARQAAEEQKKAGAERISGLGRAMHGAADELGKEIPGAADYIHSAARRLEDASSALQERSIDELVSGFSRFVRKQPAAAFAGSVVVGFALSRFLKSSGSRAEE